MKRPGTGWSLLLCAGLAAGSLACKGKGGGGSNRALDCTVAAAAGSPRAPLPPPEVSPCDLQGWCQEHPLPFVNELGPIWHRPDQTILTSERGVVLRLRDGVWESLGPLPEPATLERQGQQSLHDIWAAGDFIYLTGSVSIEGMIWIHDGVEWTAHHFEDGFRPGHVWGTRESEVMVVGGGGARLWKNGEWEAHEPPRAVGQGVWGCEDTYFAATFQGNFIDEEAMVSRFEKGAWSKTGDLPLVNVQFSAVSGTSEDNVFVSGTVNGVSEEVAWHWDGTSWTDIDYGDASPGLYDIVALGPDEAVATGVDAGGGGSVKRWAGGSWTEINGGSFLELSVATPEDILARGNLNVSQYDGESFFQPFPLPNETTMRSELFTGVWSDGQGAWFLISAGGGVFQRVGEDWSPMTTPDPQARSLNAIWGASATDVHVAGDRGLLWHWNGSDWSEVVLPRQAESDDYDVVWGLDADNVWAAGERSILYWDGATWTRPDSSVEAVVGLWGSSATDLWAVGDRGRLIHFDGLTWDDNASLPDANARPAAIWGSGPDDVWIVGEDKVWHHDGLDWSEETLVTPADANAIWGRSASDVTLVGQNGMAFHWDGSAWSDIHAEHPWAFEAVWGDANELRAVGALAIISVR